MADLSAAPGGGQIQTRQWNGGNAKTRAGQEDGLVAQTTHSAMGTVMTHRAFGVWAENSLAAVCREVGRIEGLLSRFLPDSEISRLNGSAGVTSEPVSRETYDVLSKAVEFSRCFPGCFDVTIAPLVTLWNTARKSHVEPGEISIKRALPLVDYRDLILDPWELTAGLRKVGQSLDLGGIGKGFAGDRIREVFKAFGISSAYSNLGGNVVTVGAKPDGSPWQIGIQHPRRQDGLIGSVSVVNQTVVTSGDYQRFYTDRQGKRHYHILDPMTGYPAESDLISVSIVAEESLVADPLSTIVFVAEMERGLRILTGFPDTEAILVDADLQAYVTRGLGQRFLAAEGIDVTILDYEETFVLRGLPNPPGSPLPLGWILRSSRSEIGSAGHRSGGMEGEKQHDWLGDRT